MRSEITSQIEALWNKPVTAKYLGVSIKTLDRWLAEGRGPAPAKLAYRCAIGQRTCSPTWKAARHWAAERRPRKRRNVQC